MAPNQSVNGHVAPLSKWRKETGETNKVLEMASALQRYQDRDPDAGVSELRYLLVGMQSAGKTRLLSMLAGCKLGGAEKANVGTRCPVVYSFQQPHGSGAASIEGLVCGISKEDVAQKLKSGERAKAHEVSGFVTETMGRLEAKNRFGTQPIFVHVISRGAPQFTLIDTPGLQPGVIQGANDSNASIRDIHSTFLSPTTIPIIMTSFPSNLDVSSIDKELGEFDDAAQFDQAVKGRALVCVSRLDTVKNSFERDSSSAKTCLEAFVGKACSRGFERQRVFFMCLAPEELGDNPSAFRVSEQAPWEQHDKYFAEVAPRVEKAVLPSFLSKIGLSPSQPNFGVAPVVDALEEALVKNFEMGYVETRRKLETRGAELCKKAEAFRSEDLDHGELLQRVNSHILLHTLAVAGAETDDVSRRLGDDASDMAKKYPGKVDVFRLLRARDQIKQRLRKTFAEEARSIGVPRDITCSLLDEDVGNALDELPQHPLTEKMHLKLFGEASVRRLVQYLGFCWARREHTEVDLDDLLTMAGDMDMNAKKNVTLAGILRKAILECSTSVQEDVQIFTLWLSYLVASQARVVCDVLANSVRLLDGVPRLHTFLNMRFRMKYETLVQERCEKVQQRIRRAIHEQFGTLRMEEMLANARMLMCSGFDWSFMTSVLDLPAVLDSGSDEAPNGAKSKLSEAMHILAASLKGSPMEGPARSMLHMICKIAEQQPLGPGSQLDVDLAPEVCCYFTSSLGALSSSVHDMALNEPLRMRECGEKDLKTNRSHINKLAHSITRFNCFKIRDATWTIVEEELLKDTTQLPHTVRLDLERDASDVFQEENKDLLHLLISKGGADVVEAVTLKQQIEDWVELFGILQETPRDSDCWSGVSKARDSIKKLAAFIDQYHAASSGTAGLSSLEESHAIQAVMDQLLERQERKKPEAPHKDGLLEMRQQLHSLGTQLENCRSTEFQRCREYERPLEEQQHAIKNLEQQNRRLKAENQEMKIAQTKQVNGSSKCQ